MIDKTKITFYLETSVHKSLKRIYAETGESVSSLLTKAAKEFLDKQEKNERSKK